MGNCQKYQSAHVYIMLCLEHLIKSTRRKSKKMLSGFITHLIPNKCAILPAEAFKFTTQNSYAFILLLAARTYNKDAKKKCEGY